MNANLLSVVAAAGVALAGLLSGAVPAQPDKQPSTSKPVAKAAADKRVGDPYPLANCPISDKKLGDDAVTRLYDGREVRFCCPKCPPEFEKDKAANFAKIDEKIIKDQAPLYPLKTSLVTGKDLPAKPFEFVYGNRLVRLGDEKEKVEFLKDPAKQLAAIDKATIQQQSKDYPLTTCMVSGEKFGGDMGDPVDIVVAGRMIRLCCKSCLKTINKEPAKFIAQVDEARKQSPGKAAPDRKDEKKSGG